MNRYDNVNDLWAATPAPAITRHEAERAARLLFRKFGRKTGFPRQRADVKLSRVRRCWITSKPGSGITRGWARLVHDVSHLIFRARYPHFRPHHSLHAKLEIEIASYVVLDSGWLVGALRRATKAPDEVRAAEVSKVDAAIKRWESKLRRAQNALKKLKGRRTRLSRAHASPG